MVIPSTLLAGLLIVASSLQGSSEAKSDQDHDHDHDLALRKFMDKLEKATKGHKDYLLFDRRMEMLVSLDRYGEDLAVSVPVKNTEESSRCPSKTTGKEEPRYVFLKVRGEYHGYCLQVSPCIIESVSEATSRNTSASCVFHLEDQLKEISEIAEKELMGLFDHALSQVPQDVLEQPEPSTATATPPPS